LNKSSAIPQIPYIHTYIISVIVRCGQQYQKPLQDRRILHMQFFF